MFILAMLPYIIEYKPLVFWVCLALENITCAHRRSVCNALVHMLSSTFFFSHSCYTVQYYELGGRGQTYLSFVISTFWYCMKLFDLERTFWHLLESPNNLHLYDETCRAVKIHSLNMKGCGDSLSLPPSPPLLPFWNNEHAISVTSFCHVEYLCKVWI